MKGGRGAGLEDRLGLRFRDPTLLREALTHPSAAPHRSQGLPHNQRLEFLGDSVIGLVLSHALFERFPDCPEGALTKARARCVNGETLARRARELALGDHLILGPGEERQGGRDRESNLCDLFEALVGALYLDQGFEVARSFVLRCLAEAIGEAAADEEVVNPKGALQELLQASSNEAPRYRLEQAHGPDHERVFECSVQHGGRVLGHGRGSSKRLAESAAALEALRRLRSAADAP